MPETCRVLRQNKFWIFDASIWLFYTKLKMPIYWPKGAVTADML